MMGSYSKSCEKRKLGHLFPIHPYYKILYCTYLNTIMSKSGKHHFFLSPMSFSIYDNKTFARDIFKIASRHFEFRKLIGSTQDDFQEFCVCDQDGWSI